MSAAEPYPLEIVGGDCYASLEEAQRASIDILAPLIAQAIRTGLSTGRLIVANGIVVPAALDSPLKDGV
jgi:hypothetical protein